MSTRTKDTPYLVSVNSTGFAVFRRRININDAPIGFVAGGESLATAMQLAQTAAETGEYVTWMERHAPELTSPLASQPSAYAVYSTSLKGDRITIAGAPLFEGQSSTREDAVEALLRWRKYGLDRAWWIEPIYPEPEEPEPIQLTWQTCDLCGLMRLTRRMAISVNLNGREESALFACQDCWHKEMGWRIYRNTDVAYPFEIYGFLEPRPPRNRE